MSCLDNRKNKTLVSVVVPVYKVEKYLDRCVKSLVNQTYKDIEIILVDDESPDNCPQICDRYVAKYTYVKVVHKKMMVLDRLATAVWKSPQVNISHLLIVMIL